MDAPFFIPVAELQDRSVMFRYRRFMPGDHLSYHFHEDLELQYVECGSGQRLIGGVLEPFSAGVVQFIPANVSHVWSYRWEDLRKPVPAKSYCIQFKADFLTNVMGLVPELREDAEFITHITDAVEIRGRAAVNIGRLFRVMKKQDTYDRYISFLKMLKELVNASDLRYIKVDHIRAENPLHMTKIQAVYAYLEANHDRDFTLEEVASSVGMDKSSFCKFFKRMTGQTFTASVNEMRISRAAMLLSNRKDASVSEIAYTVGYDSVSHFNHMFLKLRGETPTAYRGRFKLE